MRREGEERRFVADELTVHFTVCAIFIFAYIKIFFAADFIGDVTLGKVPPLVRSSLPPENACLRSGSLNSACIWEITAETFTQAILKTNEVVHVMYACMYTHTHTHNNTHTHTLCTNSQKGEASSLPSLSLQDVLLVHYAPWCAACTWLWPVLFAMGEAIRPSTNLIIARCALLTKITLMTLH